MESTGGTPAGNPKTIKMNRIDMLFVVPHQPKSAEILKESAGITQPLGLGYIAAFLERNGAKAAILDNSIEELAPAEFKRRVLELRPFIVGISVSSSSHNTAMELARLIKEADSSILVATGGSHASALPLKILESPDVDFVVRGEGEETSLELLKALKEGKDPAAVKGLVFRAGGKVIETPERPPIEDLDALPSPAHHLMRMDRYGLPASRRLTSAPAAAVITSRGCPYGCYFCSHNSVFKGKVRFRSPEKVLAEIEHLHENFGVGEIIFWDDSFLLDKNRAVKICRLIRESGIKITWSCSSRVDHLTGELAGEMRAAGCRLISFGVESGSPEIRTTLNKGTDLAQIRRAVGICREHRLLSFCSFMLGSPGETEKTAAQTIAFAKELDPDFAICCIFAPLPGSVFFDRFVLEGRLDVSTIDWDQYINLLSTARPVIAAGELSVDRLMELQKFFFRQFYFRPGYLLRRLAKLRSMQHLRQDMRGLKSIFKLQGKESRP